MNGEGIRLPPRIHIIISAKRGNNGIITHSNMAFALKTKTY